jgi:hypothetical protein
MKGIDQMLSAVMMIMLTIAIAVIVSGWLTAQSHDTGTQIRNQTKEKLSCTYAHLYIKNVTYNCAGDCTSGNNHNLTIVLVNDGEVAVGISNIYVRNTTGNEFQLNIPVTTFSVSDIKYLTNISRDTCSGINGSIEYVTVSGMNCPSNAYDRFPGDLVRYVDC